MILSLLNPKHKPRFENYDFIRNDRLTNKGGGTGILIRSQVKYESVNTPLNLERLEITLIKVQLSDDRSLYCGAVLPGCLFGNGLGKRAFTHSIQ